MPHRRRTGPGGQGSARFGPLSTRRFAREHRPQIFELRQKLNLPRNCRISGNFAAGRPKLAGTCRKMPESCRSTSKLCLNSDNANSPKSLSKNPSSSPAASITNSPVSSAETASQSFWVCHPNGGAFGARVSALRMWGLAKGRSTISLTDQGTQIATCTNTYQEIELMRDLAASVPLFNELHEKIGDSSVDQSISGRHAPRNHRRRNGRSGTPSRHD